MRLRLRMGLDVSTTSTAAAVSTGRREPELIRYTARSGQSGRVSAGNAAPWATRPRTKATAWPARATTTSKLAQSTGCLLYTSDAADEEDSVDLGGRRIIKKKKTTNK